MWGLSSAAWESCSSFPRNPGRNLLPTLHVPFPYSGTRVSEPLPPPAAGWRTRNGLRELRPSPRGRMEDWWCSWTCLSC